MSRKSQTAKKSKVCSTGPWCYPIVGHIPIIAQKVKLLNFHHLVWQQFSKIYGPIVGLKLVKDNLVIVSGKEMIKKLLHCEELNGRPDAFFFQIRTMGRRSGIVFTDGDFWQKQRRFSVKALRSLGLGMNGMVQQVEREASELVKSLIYHSDNGEEISIQNECNLFDVSVINVLWSIVRGERYDLNDPRLTTLMEAIHKSFQIIDMSGGAISQFPWLRFIAPVQTGYRPLIEVLEPMWDFLRQNIDEVRATFNADSEPKNFLEFYCCEISKNEGQPSSFTNEQLLSICIDFFQAGSETTSNTLAFSMLYMLHHPDVMKKVQNELETVVGNRFPKLEDRTSLKYTEATVYEILRMTNVAPLGKRHRNSELHLNFLLLYSGVAHRALADVKVGDYTIPKNAMVLFNLYSMHMDESSWKDPETFRPERFLDKNGEIFVNDSFNAFGKLLSIKVQTSHTSQGTCCKGHLKIELVLSLRNIH